MDLLTLGEALLVLAGVVIGLLLLFGIERLRQRRARKDTEDPPS